GGRTPAPGARSRGGGGTGGHPGGRPRLGGGGAGPSRALRGGRWTGPGRRAGGPPGPAPRGARRGTRGVGAGPRGPGPGGRRGTGGCHRVLSGYARTGASVSDPSHAEAAAEAPPPVRRRHHGVVRLTHWLNAVFLTGMIASGLQILVAFQ